MERGIAAVRMKLPRPTSQAGFARALAAIRKEFLQEALAGAVGSLNIADVDRELSSMVDQGALSRLASRHLRGELVFAVPCVLRACPKLLGYYRLLLGFSQKAFYGTDCGMGRFKAMEEVGEIHPAVAGQIEDLCRALVECAEALLELLEDAWITAPTLDDLTLLTVGPQLRGGLNVKMGKDAIVQVFELIGSCLGRRVVKRTPTRIEVRNASRRLVTIEVAADPDIVIIEHAGKEIIRKVAIEIKGGRDFSNVHNRIGEAEKSHQKARKSGFVECWTIVNVANPNLDALARESPSTDQFFQLREISDPKSPKNAVFRSRLATLVGIPL